jgi:hypothetical protein
MSEKIPVALIDHFTLQGLSRLGAASPMAEAETYYDKTEEPPSSAPSKLHQLAMEKLEAAKVLEERQMVKPALELLVTAVLAKAGDLGGLNKPIAAGTLRRIHTGCSSLYSLVRIFAARTDNP